MNNVIDQILMTEPNKQSVVINQSQVIGEEKSSLKNSNKNYREFFHEEQQKCPAAMRRKFNDIINRAANFLQCTRLFSNERLQELQRSADHEIEQKSFNQTTKSLSSDDFHSKMSTVEDVKTVKRKDSHDIENQKELPIRSYDMKQIQKFQKRYMETYDESYSERQVKFQYSFDEVRIKREQEYDRKLKTFWGELKRLLFCQGGTYVDEIPESYRNEKELGEIHRRRQNSRQPNLNAYNKQSMNNIFIEQAYEQLEAPPQEIKFHKRPKKNIRSSVKFVSENGETKIPEGDGLKDESGYTKKAPPPSRKEVQERKENQFEHIEKLPYGSAKNHGEKVEDQDIIMVDDNEYHKPEENKNKGQGQSIFNFNNSNTNSNNVTPKNRTKRPRVQQNNEYQNNFNGDNTGNKGDNGQGGNERIGEGNHQGNSNGRFGDQQGSGNQGISVNGNANSYQNNYDQIGSKRNNTTETNNNPYNSHNPSSNYTHTDSNSDHSLNLNTNTQTNTNTNININKRYQNESSDQQRDSQNIYGHGGSGAMGNQGMGLDIGGVDADVENYQLGNDQPINANNTGGGINKRRKPNLNIDTSTDDQPQHQEQQVPGYKPAQNRISKTENIGSHFNNTQSHYNPNSHNNMSGVKEQEDRVDLSYDDELAKNGSNVHTPSHGAAMKKSKKVRKAFVAKTEDEIDTENITFDGPMVITNKANINAGEQEMYDSNVMEQGQPEDHGELMKRKKNKKRTNLVVKGPAIQEEINIDQL